VTDTERCESTHPEAGHRCILPANHATHRRLNTAWTTLERLDGHVPVRTGDLADVLLYADGILATAPQEAIDRLNTAVTEAVKAAHMDREADQ
jgi:hypothetical protein